MAGAGRRLRRGLGDHGRGRAESLPAGRPSGGSQSGCVVAAVDRGPADIFDAHARRALRRKSRADAARSDTSMTRLP